MCYFHIHAITFNQGIRTHGYMIKQAFNEQTYVGVAHTQPPIANHSQAKLLRGWGQKLTITTNEKSSTQAQICEHHIPSNN